MFSLDRFKNVQHLIFDVDGVFTDGTLFVDDAGNLLRTMNSRDGLAIKLTIQAGLDVAIITGGVNEGVKKRFEGLGVSEIHMGVHDKLPVLEQIMQSKGWNLKNTLYMGDDLPDIPCIKAVGLGTCPADAADEVQAASDFISPKKGGDACVRDIVERVLKIQQKWPST